MSFLPNFGLGRQLNDTTASGPRVVPAGYAFAIWGPIFLGAVAYAIVVLRDRTPDVERLRLLVPYTTLAFAACMTWELIAQFVDTVEPTPFILASGLVAALAAAREFRRALPTAGWVRWLTAIPTDMLAGWLSLALFANIAALLAVRHVWPGDDRVATLIFAGGATLCVVVARLSFRLGVLYWCAAAWGLIGIAVKNAHSPLVLSGALLCAAIVVAAGLRRFPPERLS